MAMRDVLLFVPGLRGDIIAVRPAGSVWGTAECLDTFLVVGMDLTDEQACIIMERVENDTAPGWYIDLFGFDLSPIRAADWLVPTIDIGYVKAR